MSLTFVELAEVTLDVLAHDVVMVANSAGGRVITIILLGLLRDGVLIGTLLVCVLSVVRQLGDHAQGWVLLWGSRTGDGVVNKDLASTASIVSIL